MAVNLRRFAPAFPARCCGHQKQCTPGLSCATSYRAPSRVRCILITPQASLKKLTSIPQTFWGRNATCIARGQRRALGTPALQIDNRELLVGDCLAITSFCLYKQITSLLFLPDFPGWTAPLHFNPVRFEELVIFVITVCVCWVSACGIVGGYRTQATADLPTALARVSGAWLMAMPLSACNLILVTAAEERVLVGDPLFGHVLPLAARGAGEPFVTAVGVLGLMAVWRAFYTVYLDFWNSRTFAGAPISRYRDMVYFMDSLKSAFLLCIIFNIVLQYGVRVVGEENIEVAVDAVLKGSLHM